MTLHATGSRSRGARILSVDRTVDSGPRSSGNPPPSPRYVGTPDLDSLTLRANAAAAASAACESLLSGHTSEFGNTGLALGGDPYGSDGTRAILRAFSSRTQPSSQLDTGRHVRWGSFCPSLYRERALGAGDASAVPSGGTLTAKVRAASEIVSVLEDLHCFRVGFVGRPRDGTIMPEHDVQA
ncbi:hypothetical protein PHLGIDRAFT_117384 [Phlebiopsis gigantea 11061_1 CR5-6]|uniref:Uncharacterized protein n=1 Tax=Phlebiopsis gigantea (strain 11061_1 CR5-6) TaxID=745531 RepID=A0A0C3NSU9_PHLG1|nr:hypothetical protein PHLGIDRAFT_117384 [Phlebiopsis gigantea 11061_1 CR5-6]